MVIQSDSKLYKVIDSFTTMEQIVKAADSEEHGCRQGLGTLAAAMLPTQVLVTLETIQHLSTLFNIKDGYPVS